ncbi:MAG: hypothetical protein ACRELV_01310 [Longimicrobiales bacterium]
MSRTLLLATSAALAAALVTACDRDVTGLANMVHVRVDSIAKGSGSAIVDFTIVNFASESVLLDRCGAQFAVVDRREDGEWRNYMSMICTADMVMAPFPLEEGASISGRHTIEDNGVYRIRVEIRGDDVDDGAWSPTSDVFSVEVGGVIVPLQ